MLPREPLSAIFPIAVVCCAGEETTVRAFLGTGFFCGADGWFLTCRHVLEIVEQPPDCEVAILQLLPNGIAIASVVETRFSNDYDIAAGRVEVTPQMTSLILGGHDAYRNDALLCVEFSDSVPRRDATRTMIRFTPSFHHGNVVSTTVADLPPGRLPTSVLDVSFPALRGASGAPVMEAERGCVVGMLAANVERHLLPAQVERVETAASVVEEIRYFLPHGRAISWKHLRQFAETLGVEPWGGTTLDEGELEQWEVPFEGP